jgi:hypothetical protein
MVKADLKDSLAVPFGVGGSRPVFLKLRHTRITFVKLSTPKANASERKNIIPVGKVVITIFFH